MTPNCPVIKSRRMRWVEHVAYTGTQKVVLNLVNVMTDLSLIIPTVKWMLNNRFWRPLSPGFRFSTRLCLIWWPGSAALLDETVLPDEDKSLIMFYWTIWGTAWIYQDLL
jgi:hypothetical protein